MFCLTNVQKQIFFIYLFVVTYDEEKSNLQRYPYVRCSEIEARVWVDDMKEHVTYYQRKTEKKAVKGTQKPSEIKLKFETQGLSKPDCHHFKN